MSRFFVFIVVLVVSSLAGCKQLQPVIETKTIIDTAFIEIENKESLLKLIECDSNYQALWLNNVELQKIWDEVKFDTSKSIPAKIIVKKMIQREVDTVYKGVIIPKEKIIFVEKTPFWAYLTLYLSIGLVISSIILFFLLMKKFK